MYLATSLLYEVCSVYVDITISKLEKKLSFQNAHSSENLDQRTFSS